jgi:TonB family protein
MSERNDEPRLADSLERRDAAEERKIFADEELSALLHEWRAPCVSRQLDERVMASYRRRINDAAAIGQTVSEIDKMVHADARRDQEKAGQVSKLSEVSKMKQCPTCLETFADKFAFCPVDGTRLKPQVAATVPPAKISSEKSAEPTQAVKQDAPANGDAASDALVASVSTPPAPSVATPRSAPNANVLRAMQNAESQRATPTANLETNGGNGASSSNAASKAATPDDAAASANDNSVVSPRVTPTARTAPVTSALKVGGNGEAKTDKAARAAAVTAGAAAFAAAANGAKANAPEREEYHLTILEDKGLSARLVAELREVAQASQLTWPEFKRAPLAFIKRMLSGYGRAFARFLRTENVMPAIVTSFVIVLTLIGVVFVLEHKCTTFAFIFKNRCEQEQLAEDLEIKYIDLRNQMIPEEQPKPTPDKGIGAADKAESRVGFNKGRGEGSKPQFEKAQGGGGGGMKEPTPAQQGALPPPSPIPAAIPKVPPTTMPKLPAGMDIDPALHKDLPFPVYGDPNSKSNIPSNGPGDKGGMGNGAGVGIGPGEGGGYGPGRGGNMGDGYKNIGGGGSGGGRGENGIDYNKPFSASQVTKKAVITYKPEPGFTEEARKNNTTGIVRVRALLTSSGVVTNITPLNRLPDGLTERAIAAARQVKFIPAEKDGHVVSQWVTFEYNFNIY